MAKNNIAYSREPRPTNIQDYVMLKQVRANTALIDGKIIYNGIVWEKQEYLDRFPEPTLEYLTTQGIDPTKINY